MSTCLYGQYAKNAKPVERVLFPFDTLSKSKSIVHYYQKNWDNYHFNPYQKDLVKFPFEIVFTEDTYHSPIKRKKLITSRYGWRNRRAHAGIDIDLVTGDTVFAMLEGKIRYANYHSGHGKTIVVRHKNGLETVYAHLSDYIAKENDTVLKGQAIGLGGNTGHSHGSHLHLEVHYQGITLNPEAIFNFDESNTLWQQRNWITNYWATPYLHRASKQSNIQLYATKEDAIASEIKKKIQYTVKPGDTLSKIAHAYSVSIASICKINSLTPKSIIHIGQHLTLLQ
ncbi:M23 family metallopeptidase [Ochrovirga pacifica]|uniref:M23 family metallopeptidase n=1 Tax=Ochrovirga pacifica TaxID=1042376 RepID=UPI0002D70F19|nr:M23 family metallopeptidase [Ochrovirga pacifica]